MEQSGKIRCSCAYGNIIIFETMMEIVLSVCYFLLGVFLIGRSNFFKIAGIPVSVFRGLFVIKVCAAILLFIIYTRFYTEREKADIFRYYDDSALIFNTLPGDPAAFFSMMTGIGGEAPHLTVRYDAMRNWYNSDMVFNDSRTMIRISALLRILTFNTYFPQAVIFCFLAFTGLTGLFRVLNHHLPGKSLLLMLLVFLLPSTLIWTSGLIKEAFLMFAMGLFFYHFHQALSLRRLSLQRGCFLLFAAGVLVIIKAYVFFLIVPLLISWWLFSSSRSMVSLKVSVLFIAYFLLLTVCSFLLTGHEVPTLLSEKQSEFYAVAQRDNARSVVEIPRLTDEWQSLILAAPGAFLRTLAYPHPGQAHNLLMWFSVMENLLLAVVIVFLLYSLRRRTIVATTPFIVATFLFASSLFILAGWVVPVIGALVRYRVPALPFILLPLVYWSPAHLDFEDFSGRYLSKVKPAP